MFLCLAAKLNLTQSRYLGDQLLDLSGIAQRSRSANAQTGK
jgi:hypothetical protein